MSKKGIWLTLSLLLGFVLCLLPTPEGLKPEGWRLLSIFIATLLAIITQALPMAALTLIAIAACVITKTLPLKEALSGFGNPVIWLVVLAFFISRGFIATGLGSRAAYFFMRLLGKSTLGLSYGIMATDLILAPAIPSVTARAGGVVYPIVSGLAKAFGSEPGHHTSKKISSFLTQVAFQGTCITSAMFLTAMAGNPLIRQIASKSNIDLSWGLWAKAALVPGLLSMLIVPLVIYKLYPPQIKGTPQAKKMATEKLKEMGPMSINEWIMLGVFLLLIVLWAGESFIGVSATTAAFVGLAILLITKVLNWKDLLQEHGAWDTFIWLGSLVMLAGQLYELGVTNLLSDWVVAHVSGLHWMTGFLILSTAYFFAHYFFAGNMAHIGALYPPFLVLSLALGTPPVIAALLLGFYSNLFGSLTHYGTGPAPIFFGSGHVDIRSWWKLGFVCACVNIVIWLVGGGIWWKFLGLW